jgi:hypothetical protein
MIFMFISSAFANTNPYVCEDGKYWYAEGRCCVKNKREEKKCKEKFDERMANEQGVEDDKCPEGQYWYAAYNRCLTPSETDDDSTTERITNTSDDCANLTGDAYNECLQNNARTAHDTNVEHEGDLDADASKKGFTGKGWSTAIASTFIAVNGIIVTKKGFKIKQCPTSAKLIMGASALAFGNEIYFNWRYKRELKKIQEEYKNSVTSHKKADGSVDYTSANANQVRAFNALIDQEKELEKNLNWKGGVYAATAGLYGVALIAAIKEAAQNKQSPGSVKSCTGLQASTEEVKEVEDVIKKDLGPVDSEIPKNKNEQIIDVIPEENYGTIRQSYSIDELVARTTEISDQASNFNANYVLAITYQLLSAISSEARAADPPEGAVDISSTISDLPEGWKVYQVGDQKIQYDENGNGSVYLDEVTVTPNGPQQSPPDEMDESAETTGFIKNVAQGIGKGYVKFRDWVAKLYKTPGSRIVLAGAMGTYTGFVAAKNFKEAKNAKERWKALEEIKINFQDQDNVSMDGCTEDDRMNPSKPFCYCYNEGGEKNQARVNSETCSLTWGKVGKFDPTDYTQTNASSNAPKSCVTNTGKLDNLCGCKRKKGRDGKNTCMRLSQAMNFLGTLGNSKWAKGLMDQSDGLASGNLSAADLNGADLLRKAAKIRKKADEYGLKTLKGNYKKAQKAQKDLDRGIRNRLGSRLPALGRAMASATPATPLSNMGSNKKKADIKKSAMAAIKKGRVIPSSYSNNAGEDDFDFGLGGGGEESGVVIEGAEKMAGKNFNFGDMDINKRKQDSIFKIITLRYHKSGYDRLFELSSKEENESKPKK